MINFLKSILTKHNLRAADYNIKGGFSDWGVSQSYYAMYHSLLAVLFKLGYELNLKIMNVRLMLLSI